MKKLLFISYFSLMAFSSFATDPLAETEELNTKQKIKNSLIQSNIFEITNFKNKYTELSDELNNFTTCQGKKKLFIGFGAKHTDDDGCIDIKNKKAPPRSLVPTFEGYLTTKRRGDLTDTETKDESNASQTWGRFRADVLCRQAYSNTRAMTYDDLKYMMYYLPRDKYEFTGTESDTKIWLFDASGANSDSVPEFTKNYVTDIGTCEGWLSKSSSKYGTVLALDGVGTSKKIIITKSRCDNKELIACVKN